MTAEMIRRLSPEEEELAAKRSELALLEAQLADLELALASLKAELAGFAGLYLRRVGVLYAELDEFNARLAELKAEKVATPEMRAEAEEARAQAAESHSAAHGEAAQVLPFTPSPELKKLYREAAKQVHPDTALNDADRARRERLMKAVNAAYAAGDEEALRRIIAELESSPDAVQGEGAGVELVRILRHLRIVRDRINGIELELSSLKESETALLKQDCEKAEAEGRDLLEEISASVRAKIEMAKSTYESLLAEVRAHER